MSVPRRVTLTNGLAMFSMFFGAGNVIFPLIVGRVVEGSLPMALLGLFLTAVIIPFTGLLSITLYEGDYMVFFRRIGKYPGFIVMFAVVCLIGPFGGLPRCIGLTYASLKVYFPHLQLYWFSALSCGLIFMLCWKKNRVLDLLGYVLTPILLVFLCFIITKGIIGSPASVPRESVGGGAFLYGLKEGYNMMDLLAAFFFSSLICQRIRAGARDKNAPMSDLIKPIIKACLIGAVLLGVIYTAFSFVASVYRSELASIHPDQLLGAIGQVVVGKNAGFIVCVVIALSCLTTSIALAVICAEFCQKHIPRAKVRYEYYLVIILAISWLVSTLEFSGIVRALSPVLKVCYPSLLALSIVNILHKLYGFQPVKIPIFIIFISVLFFSFVV
jgi:branched-chain amino acid:cation transporter, LIVCS family